MIFMMMALALLGDVYDGIPVTRNLDPYYIPDTYEDWLANQPDYQPFSARTVAGTDGAEFLLIFNNGLTDSLEAGVLDQWTSDIASQGLSWEVVEVSYSTPEDLKDYLTDKYNDGMEGAVLIGNIPVAWVMLENSFGGNENFPCDYFYMDLDGTWEDNWVGYPSGGVSGSDGKYDTFSGSLDPEIYTGRIKVDNLAAIADPIDMLNDYIERLHDWRMTGGPDPLTALCYVDDDWAGWGSSYRQSMQELYPNTILVNDINGTNGTDYRDVRLPDAYVWISPYVHSGPNVHQWAQGPSTYWSDIIPANPQAHFYNLFACSNARFTTSRSMGQVYAFATSTGLASVGSTKTGSMLQFTQFYYPLGQGASLGEAYKEWWTFITSGGFSWDERSWHLGMVVLGDPTLMPAMHMLGIDDEETGGEPVQAELLVAQNPCSSELVLTFDGADAGSVQIFDTCGRLLGEGVLSNHQCQMSVADLECGLYFARVTAGEISASASVIVIR